MKKILIVEDELPNVILLEKVFKEDGYEVFSAVNGEKGLESAIKNEPDLILLDIRMPVMDGLTMLSELRKSGLYGARVQVIILTNLEPDVDVVKKIVTDQPTLYIIKSNTKLDELKQKVKDLLKESSIIAQSETELAVNV